MGFMLFIELYCLEADVESMIFLSRFFFIHVVYRCFHFSSFLKLYFTTFHPKLVEAIVFRNVFGISNPGLSGLKFGKGGLFY